MPGPARPRRTHRAWPLPTSRSHRAKPRCGQSGRVLHVDDFLEDGKLGYRAVHAQVEIGSGISAEVQIVPRAIAEIQDEAHALRQPFKRLDPDLMPAGTLADYKAAMARSRSLF